MVDRAPTEFAFGFDAIGRLASNFEPMASRPLPCNEAAGWAGTPQNTLQQAVGEIKTSPLESMPRIILVTGPIGNSGCYRRFCTTDV